MMITRWFTSLLLFGAILALAVASQGAAITQVMGGAVDCDPKRIACGGTGVVVSPAVCSASCPLRTAPSFTTPTRFWGPSSTGTGNCRVSVDGGATWNPCTSQPFATGSNELYAEAADGSVIAVGTTTGPTTCNVARSTDLGVNWGIVFTQAGSCSAGGNEGQRLFCFATGSCLFVWSDGSNSQVFRSGNNGLTWTAGEVGTSPNGGTAGAAWDGTVGVFPSIQSGFGGGNLALSFFSTGALWSDSTAWTGTQGNCWGPVVWQGNPRVVCQAAGASPDSRYTLRSVTGATVQSLTLPDAFLGGTDAGGIALAVSSSQMYIVASDSSSNAGVWVSRDSLSTFTKIAALPAASVRGGNMFYINGCVYITYAGPPRFTKIC